MENLKDIISEIVRYKKMGLSNLSDDVILDCATRIFISENIERSQRERKPFYTSSVQEPPIEEKATDKQLSLLKKIGYKGNLDLTKREAFKVLNELLPKKTK